MQLRRVLDLKGLLLSHLIIHLSNFIIINQIKKMLLVIYY